jgi:ubiquinone/menaquinone biosynthesis C-methylase UbiE
MKEIEIKRMVREGYSRIAKKKNLCCLPSCEGDPSLAEKMSNEIGYSQEDFEAIPKGVNMGLGCGNPVAYASLKEGETVLDLGSGAGLDCFLAANKVGRTGRVIGVDMTPEMIKKAEELSKMGEYGNVEFKLGEIEDLPLADDSVDVVISNCVINLSPDKRKVFREAFRVLKPGGRLMISDIMLLKELPDSMKNSVEAYIGCIAGAMLKDDYIRTIKEACFEQVAITDEKTFPADFLDIDAIKKSIKGNLKSLADKIKESISSVVSVKVTGFKPKRDV